ncbi:hypothetical protein N431DRAFT_466728 [Stipitochalara longipes BDJ]|nr:hypothetical protein N431DRAFT_466728 [Stipitochalara longipes BDJ]
MSGVVSNASPLAESFQRCSRSFKKLYLALFAYGPISLSKFNDEYGRFGVWGGDSGADRTGRGSLDDVLRNDPKTTSIIAEVLENLEEDLNTCIALAEASAGPHEPQSPGGQEWLSDEESSISSGSDLDETRTGSRVPSKMQRILHLLAIVVDHIQSLFQVSALLRRPTISDKYLRSVSKRKSATAESPFLHWDLAHVVEKRRLWIRQQKWHVPAELDEAENDTQQMSTSLCKRLATANVRRREQLDFWQIHPAQPSTVKLPDEPIRPKPVAIPDSIPAGQLIKKTVSKSEMSKPSHGTKQSFSTVAKSDLNDSATFSGRPRTEYASSSKGGKFVLRIPPLPKVQEESPTLKCPYCSTTLDAKSMSQRELWKKHVFRDLRPYVCTFAKCENPEKLYLTRHEWMYHETQMHRRQWICASCSHRKLPTRNEMRNHLLDMHSGDFPEAQLEIMVEICERPMDDDEGVDCPICFATLALSALRVHLATHLEELALFVLPCHIEDRSQDAGSDRAEGAGRHLASDASSSDDELPALEFEKSLPESPHSQDPEMFSALLQSQQESEHKHMEEWFSLDHQSETQDHRENNDVATPLAEVLDASSQQPRSLLEISSSLEEHVNNFPYVLPSQLTAGTPDAVEWLEDTKSRYLKALSIMETSDANIQAWDNQWDSHIQKRREEGNPLSLEEENDMEKERAAIQKHHAEAKAFVDNFRAQQSAQTTDELCSDSFLSVHFITTLNEARRLQFFIEQLAVNILDRQGPKSEVTVGGMLAALESLDLGLPRHKSYWATFDKTCHELESCIEAMRAIIQATRDSLLEPTSTNVEGSIWDSEKNVDALITGLKECSLALHRATVVIVHEYLPILKKASVE